MDRYDRRLFGLLVGGHLLFTFMLPILWEEAVGLAMGSEGPLMCFFVPMFGGAVGQVTLLAVWAAFGPSRLIDRGPLVVFTVGLMWYALLLGTTIVESGMPGPWAISLGLVIVVGFLVLQAPLWVMRRDFGWSVTLAGMPKASGLTLIFDTSKF